MPIEHAQVPQRDARSERFEDICLQRVTSFRTQGAIATTESKF